MSGSPKGMRQRWSARGLLRDSVADDLKTEVVSDSSAENAAELLDSRGDPPPVLQASTVPAAASGIDGLDDFVTQAALQRSKRTISDLKQPWEQGPLKKLFSAQTPAFLRRNTNVTAVGLFETLTASASSEPKSSPMTTSSHVRHRRRFSRLVQSEDALRRVALSRISTMVLMNPSGTSLGRSLMSFAGTLTTDAELSQVFMDVFAPKSTGTLVKRSNAVWRFSHWLHEHNLGSPFCQSEQVLYRYLNYLRDTGAGATAASSFVEALRFFDSLLGFKALALKDMLTPRVVGCAHSQFVTKRKRKPAELLTVDEITHLENTCLDQEERPIVRLLAGHFLFCFASTARWHDSMYIDSLELSTHKDVVLLEASTTRDKTSVTKELKTQLLPFTALGRLMSRKAWGESFVGMRDHFGFDHSTLFLPSWSDELGRWADSRMSTSEATEWLRETLTPAVGTKRASTLTVHGLKATMCSWAAKSMLFTPEEQIALGHHVSTLNKSALIYSRDNQIALCVKIYKLLAKIESGSFHPDRSRAERLFELASQVERELETTEVSGDSDSDSMAESDGGHEKFGPAEEPVRLPIEEATARRCVVHNFSRVIHLRREAEDDRLGCGRLVTANYHEATDADFKCAASVVCAGCSSHEAAQED